MKTAIYKWTIVDDVLIIFSGEGKVAEDAKWESFIADIKQRKCTKFLGATMGASEVTSIQRKEANDIIKQKKMTVALITDQSVVRGMATAASWFGVNIKAFSWDEARAATKYLAINAHQENRIYNQLLELRDSCK